MAAKTASPGSHSFELRAVGRIAQRDSGRHNNTKVSAVHAANAAAQSGGSPQCPVIVEVISNDAEEWSKDQTVATPRG